MVYFLLCFLIAFVVYSTLVINRKLNKTINLLQGVNIKFMAQEETLERIETAIDGIESAIKEETAEVKNAVDELKAEIASLVEDDMIDADTQERLEKIAERLEASKAKIENVFVAETKVATDTSAPFGIDSNGETFSQDDLANATVTQHSEPVEVSGVVEQSAVETENAVDLPTEKVENDVETES